MQQVATMRRQREQGDVIVLPRRANNLLNMSPVTVKPQRYLRRFTPKFEAGLLHRTERYSADSIQRSWVL
jgi:hypothetical protein